MSINTQQKDENMKLTQEQREFLSALVRVERTRFIHQLSNAKDVKESEYIEREIVFFTETLKSLQGGK